MNNTDNDKNLTAATKRVLPTHRRHSEWDELEKVALLRCTEHDILHSRSSLRQLYSKKCIKSPTCCHTA